LQFPAVRTNLRPLATRNLKRRMSDAQGRANASSFLAVSAEVGAYSMGVKEQIISRAFTGDSGSLRDSSRHDFLAAAAALLVGLGLPGAGVAGRGQHGAGGSSQRVVVVIFGGVRRAETFSPEGIENIPHLSAKCCGVRCCLPLKSIAVSSATLLVPFQMNSCRRSSAISYISATQSLPIGDRSETTRLAQLPFCLAHANNVLDD